MPRIFTYLIFNLLFYSAVSQSDSSKIEGWTFGALPAIAYDADFGLLYGGVANIYYYGDKGIRYPYYDHSIFFEWTNTTRGERSFTINYDGRTVIPEGRISAEVGSVRTLARPFYGFNGYKSLVSNAFITPDNPSYISKLFYSFEQSVTFSEVTLEKNLKGKLHRATATLGFNTIDISEVDVDRYNNKKSVSDQIPDTASLYEKYVKWGIIRQNESRGGALFLAGVGWVVDSRDIEPFPTRGLWETIRVTALWPENHPIPLFSILLTHRQYHRLVSDKLVLAYRVGINYYLSDNIPFYLLHNLGGGNTIRGIRFARVAAPGIAMSNLEVRWKVATIQLFGQQFYGALSTFWDSGISIKQQKINIAQVPADERMFVHAGKEALHHGFGVGGRVALNENFIVALDYGQALNSRDGDNGIYIGLNWLF